MCNWGQTTLVMVKIPADLSTTEKEKWKDVRIDSCIASIVKALQDKGIDMRGSCCGHGSGFGDIHLQDGRILILTDEIWFSPWKFFWRVFIRTIKLQFRTWRNKY